MIVTENEVKSSLMPEMMNSADSTLLTALINDITSQAEAYINAYLIYAEYTEVLGGQEGMTVALLKGMNISAINVVKFNGFEQDVTQFTIDNRLGGIVSKRGFPVGYNNIEIEYSAGYNTTTYPAPAGLKRAVIDEVVVRYEYLRSQSKTGENIADLKKDFLSSRSERYLKKLRREVLW